MAFISWFPGLTDPSHMRGFNDIRTNPHWVIGQVAHPFFAWRENDRVVPGLAVGLTRLRIHP